MIFAVWSSPKLHTLNLSHNSLEQLPTNWPQVLSECTVINASPPTDSTAQVTEIGHCSMLLSVGIQGSNTSVGDMIY